MLFRLLSSKTPTPLKVSIVTAFDGFMISQAAPFLATHEYLSNIQSVSFVTTGKQCFEIV
jgi:hypothetical protein